MKYIWVVILVLSAVFLKAESTDPGSDELLLDQYLEGAAGYCDKLRTEAFHFICRERISIRNEELLVESLQPERRRIQRKKYRKRYWFDYQIISKNREVSERRIKKGTSPGAREIDPSKLLLFFIMEKSVFGPNSILDADKQDGFHFKLLGKEDGKKREFVIIEAIPKTPGKIFFSSAKIFLYPENYSVWRLDIVPTHMKGYKTMLKAAHRFKSQLILKCEMVFGHEYRGLYFPTKIEISERYKGGAFIYRNMGPAGWEKSMTVFKYSGYQFFKVDTEVKIQE